MIRRDKLLPPLADTAAGASRPRTRRSLLPGCAALLLLLPSLGLAFDFDSYRDESLDELLRHARELVETRAHDAGVEIIFPLTKLHLFEALAEQPYACDGGDVATYLGIMGIGVEQQLPPIDNCIKIRADSGQMVTFYVQNEVANFIPQEVPLGQKMHLYAIWVYVSNDDSLPYLLLNEFRVN